MANRFWNFVTVLVGGTLAKASDVNSSLSGIQTGFDDLEAEVDSALTVSTAPGDMTIGENAAARANKLIAFDINGDIVLSTTIGTYRGNHANAAGTAYYVRDVVKDAAASLGLNNLYICQTAHTSTGGLLADTANWALLVDVASVVASQVAAAASAAAAATSYDNFDDRYLGAFTTAASPTLDNDGNAIITGALFFDTTLNRMKVRTSGATWVLTTANAVDVNITDAGSRITATEVEGALQEIAANDYTTNLKLANMATQTIKGRTTAGTGDPEDLTAAQVSTMLGTVATQAGAETLTNKTLTSPVLNGTLNGSLTNTSWNPTIWDSSASDAEGQTYSTNSGRYIRVGSIVFISGIVTLTSIGTLTAGSQAYIGNLPFTPAAIVQPGIIINEATGLSITAGDSVTGIFSGFSPYLALHKWSATTGTSSLLISELSADGHLAFHGFYFI